MSRHQASPRDPFAPVATLASFAQASRVFLLLILFYAFMGGSVLSAQAATEITFTAEELLGKPTNNSVTINIVPASTIEYHYQYRPASESSYSMQTGNSTATADQPHEIVISGLAANTEYYYRMRYHLPGETDWVERPEHSFWTQRAEGSTFVFAVTSDTHYNLNTTFTQAMDNILTDQPDFLIDLGDTFMVDNAGSETQSAYNTRYLAFREQAYLDRIAHSVPIFLSPGNHEEEEGWNLDDTPSRALLDIQARKAFYPTPVDQGAGGFYSGNTDTLAAIDEVTYGDEYREEYYAWEWGDALFVVIDPFQYTLTMPYTAIAGEESDETVVTDQWLWTLGDQQYTWLKQTLESSTARYKFMFSHQMVGGVPDNSVSGGAGYVRGGAEAAGYFEWGGKNFDGTDGFSTHRPDWDMPIHQLMVENGVSAYFHGHDHQYVYEKRGSIVYQEVPSPSMTGAGFSGIYTVGTYPEYETIAMYPSTGHLRITVTPSQATVDYVRSNTTGVSYSYTIAPNTPPVTHDLTIAVDPVGGGTTTPAVGLHTYTEGTNVNVTATPALGYAFDYWSGACTGSGACSVAIDADKSVTAHFKTVPTYVLTTAVEPSGGGTISPAPGDHTYNENTVVDVTATPNSGYVFAGWSGACSGSGACSVTMDADKSVTAHFAVKTTFDLAVAVAPAGGGSTDPAVGVHSYGAGAVVSVTAAPAPGFVFAGWGGACSGTGCCTVTMDADKTVTASFAPAVSYVGEIGSATIKDSGTADLVITTSAAVAAGNAIVVAYACDASQDINLTVSDSAGNRYQQAGMAISQGNLRTYIFAAYDVTALPSGGTITINQAVYSSTAVAARAAVASTFRGLAPAGALEQTNNASGTSTTPSTGAAATVQPVQLLIGAVGTEGPSGDTAGTWQNSFTAGARAGTTGGTDDTNVTVSLGWQIVTSAGSYTAAKSGITSRDWAALIATFKTTDAGLSYIDNIGRAQSKTAGTSLAITTDRAVAAGDDILVAFAADEEGTVSSVTDSAGNTYELATQAVFDQSGAAAGVRTHIYAAYNVAALPSGSTITINHTSVTARSAAASVFRGLAGSAVVDQTKTATGTSTSPSSGASGTTTQADELLIGAIGTEGPHVDSPGVWSNAFTEGPRLGTSYGASSGDATDITVTMGWRIVGATGAYTAAKSGLATSRDWAAAIATFKADYRLTVAVDPAGSATTSPAVGAHSYSKGTVVPVTPTAGAGYVFDHWSGACTGSGACSVTMNADKTVTAHFAVSVNVAISKSGNNPKLDWTHQAAAVDHYAVYRSLTAPYFAANADTWLVDVPTSAPTHTDTTADLTEAGSMCFYLVGPVNACGGPCGASNRTGAFVFGLTPGN